MLLPFHQFIKKANIASGRALALRLYKDVYVINDKAQCVENSATTAEDRPELMAVAYNGNVELAKSRATIIKDILERVLGKTAASQELLEVIVLPPGPVRSEHDIVVSVGSDNGLYVICSSDDGSVVPVVVITSTLSYPMLLDSLLSLYTMPSSVGPLTSSNVRRVLEAA